MINIRDADLILNIKMVGDLFTNDIDKIKNEYKDLVKIWHPDINNDLKANDVFIHINELYQLALDLISVGKWEKRNYVRYQTKDGKKLDINYLKEQPFELGTAYICNKHIIYVFDKDKKLFYDNALSKIKNLKYADQNMEVEIQRIMPEIFSAYETIDNEYCYVIRKSQEIYCLNDILSYYKGTVPDKHVAWMMTRLCNLLCYLDYTELSHNGITIHNCFLSPEEHSIMIYGGWWYSQKQNDKLIGISKDIFNVMPLSVKSSKKASITTDIESVKLVGRTLLGDSTGAKLSSMNIPQSFINWLNDGSSNSAYEEAQRWDIALQKAYGPRKFIKMDISKSDIYKN